MELMESNANPPVGSPVNLTLRLLGHPDLTLNNHPAPRPLSDKALALLIYLALEGHRDHGRRELITLLWPESSRDAGQNSLRQALFSTRVRLPTDPPILTVSRTRVGFEPSVTLRLDVVDFTVLIDACTAHAHSSLDTCAPCMDRLEQAVALYRGDFLAGFSLPDNDQFQTWQVARQEMLRGQFLAALSHLAAAHTRRKEYKQAIAHLRRSLAMAPWQEEIHRQTMRVLALDGQRGAALNQFYRCRKFLQDDLDVDPTPETLALRDRILSNLIEVETVGTGNPYRGISAFGEENAADFHGRGKLSQQLLDAVLNQPSVAVIGPSGSGKSSLVHAGLLPELRALGSVVADPADAGNGEIRADWEIIELQLSPDPMKALVEATRPVDPSRLNGSTSPSRRLLIVDSLEEVFILCPAFQARQAFFDRLFSNSNAPVSDSPTSVTVPMTILLILGTESRAQAIPHPHLADVIQHHGMVINPMDRSDLRQAVEEPALGRNVQFESGLVQRLLADVGDDPGNLSLLQFCLTQLWDHQESGMLTHATYDDLGGVSKVLGRYADGIFDALSTDGQDEVRRILLRLVQPGIRAAGTRRWAGRQEFSKTGWAMVQHLVSARLLVTRRAIIGQEQAALAHETLIRHWGCLRELRWGEA